MQHPLMTVRLFTLLLSVVLISACESPRAGGVTTSSLPSAVVAEQTLAPGDVIRLQFVGAPEQNQTQRVRSDGRITAPMIGEMVVAGKQPDAVQRELAGLYKSKLQNSELYVTVESSSASIYVAGAVNKPGKVVLDRQLTVLEAIMEAGGFARGLADTSRVQIIRKINGKHQTLVVDLTKALKGQTTDVVYVQRYDVIQVPEKWL